MHYLVHGRDVPGLVEALDPDDVDEDALDEAHWSYMDRWADRLIARGPTLSPDGSLHTGSVHVVDLPDPDAARAFAFEEPYYLAGLYETVTIRPFAPVLGGTMWDRPAEPEQPATLVLIAWDAVDHTDEAVNALRAAFAASDAPWVFAGALLDDEACSLRGLAAAVDLAPAETDDAFARVLASVPGRTASTERHRWRRGGRPTS